MTCEEALLRARLPKYWGQFSRLKTLTEIQPRRPQRNSYSIPSQKEAA